MATNQGKCVCEWSDGAWLVMFPNGEIISNNAKDKAEAACKKWFASHLRDSVGVGIIEWRGIDAWTSDLLAITTKGSAKL